MSEPVLVKLKDMLLIASFLDDELVSDVVADVKSLIELVLQAIERNHAR